MKLWLIKLEQALEDFLINFLYHPETDPKTLPMNQDPVSEYEPPRSEEVVPPSTQLAQTARGWLGKDASPFNKAPQELSCAESVVNVVNSTWSGTLDPKIVGTDTLFAALKKSPRFQGVLEPVAGCIEVSPRTGATYGHCGIYVGPDSIASNDSRDGKFRENYTRATWRKTFIQGRGLKAYLFVPVDL